MWQRISQRIGVHTQERKDGLSRSSCILLFLVVARFGPLRTLQYSLEQCPHKRELIQASIFPYANSISWNFGCYSPSLISETEQAPVDMSLIGLSNHWLSMECLFRYGIKCWIILTVCKMNTRMKSLSNLSEITSNDLRKIMYDDMISAINSQF